MRSLTSTACGDCPGLIFRSGQRLCEPIHTITILVVDSNIKVFLSTGNGVTSQQEAFIRSVEVQIRELGFEHKTVGRNVWSPKQPLIPIEGTLRECSGTVVVAFERVFSDSAIERRSTSRQRLLSQVRTTTPWNHIEAGMAYLLGHPLLVLAEDGLHLEGLVDRGYDWAINFVSLTPDGSFLFPNEATQPIFLEWSRDVRRFHENMSKRDTSSTLDHLTEAFGIEELREIAFRLGAEPEDIKGATRPEYAREMIVYFKRRGNLGDLLAKCRSLRPHIQW
jgi:Effector-associated domain 7